MEQNYFIVQFIFFYLDLYESLLWEASWIRIPHPWRKIVEKISVPAVNIFLVNFFTSMDSDPHEAYCNADPDYNGSGSLFSLFSPRLWCRKDNCMECAPCRNDKSHQICKMRRCDRLTEKKINKKVSKKVGNFMKPMKKKVCEIKRYY